MERLGAYCWPGNVRQLQSVIRRAILMASGPVIGPENLTDELLASQDGHLQNGNIDRAETQPISIVDFVQQRMNAGANDIYAATLELMERKLITKILSETGGNQSKAAKCMASPAAACAPKPARWESLFNRSCPPSKPKTETHSQAAGDRSTDVLWPVV